MEKPLSLFTGQKNNASKPIIGNSVYSVIPTDAGLYFNKIQCFCFDEQLINPGEEVDLPILFYLDPIFATDSRCRHITNVQLSYFFFESESEVPEDYKELEELKAFQKEKNQVRLQTPIAEAKDGDRTATIYAAAEKLGHSGKGQNLGTVTITDSGATTA